MENVKFLKCSRCGRYYRESETKIIIVGLMGIPVVLCPECYRDFLNFMSDYKYLGGQLSLREHGKTAEYRILPQ